MQDVVDETFYESADRQYTMIYDDFFANRDFIIICGHYGCGKTNLALNIAVDAAKRGEKVTLVDLDLVNPYFRSSDYPELLRDNGIELLASGYAHSNLDIPSIPAEMYGMFSKQGKVILDVGGDDAGAVALGRFSHLIKEREYTFLYVVNRFRIETTSPEQAAQVMSEIREASRLEPHYIVNNSHLMEHTDEAILLEGYEFAKKTAELTGLPLAFTAVEKRLAAEAENRIENIYPVDIYVRKVWE